MERNAKKRREKKSNEMNKKIKEKNTHTLETETYNAIFHIKKGKHAKNMVYATETTVMQIR